MTTSLVQNLNLCHLEAYRLAVGVAASIDQMVNILGAANEAEVGTIAEQEAFFSDWVTRG